MKLNSTCLQSPIIYSVHLISCIYSNNFIHVSTINICDAYHNTMYLIFPNRLELSASGPVFTDRFCIFSQYISSNPCSSYKKHLIILTVKKTGSHCILSLAPYISLFLFTDVLIAEFHLRHVPCIINIFFIQFTFPLPGQFARYFHLFKLDHSYQMHDTFWFIVTVYFNFLFNPHFLFVISLYYLQYSEYCFNINFY